MTGSVGTEEIKEIVIRVGLEIKRLNGVPITEDELVQKFGCTEQSLIAVSHLYWSACRIFKEQPQPLKGIEPLIKERLKAEELALQMQS